MNKFNTLLLFCALFLTSLGQAMGAHRVSPLVYIDKAVAGLPAIPTPKGGTFQLFTHGRPGQLFMNGDWKNAQEIAAFLAPQIKTQGIQSVNIYGCEFGKDQIGHDAVQYLTRALGVPVAASNNITGQSGDWVLEVGKAANTISLPSYKGNLQYGAGGCMGTQTVTMAFTGTPAITGTANTVGSTYRYSNVLQGAGVTQQVDAVFTLNALSFGTAKIDSSVDFQFDVPGSTIGYDNNFQPSFVSTKSGGALIPYPALGTYVLTNTWTVNYYLPGTTTPVSLPTVLEVFDNDGATSAYPINEIVRFDTQPSAIVTSSSAAGPTTETVVGNTVTSNNTTITGITDSLRYMVYANFPSISSFQITFKDSIKLSAGVNWGNRYHTLSIGCQNPGLTPFPSLSLSGNVYNDANGMFDNTVNGTGGGTFSGVQLYANLLSTDGVTVLATVPVNANGTYTLPVGANANYMVQITQVQGTVGSPAPATTLPPNWVYSGEKVGTGTGSDGNANGLLAVTVGATNVTNVNYGLNYTNTDPDINAGWVNQNITGSVKTNDEVPEGTTYGSPTAVAGNPTTALPVMNSDGTYTFNTTLPGVYQFMVPVCPPGVSSGCPMELLTITVEDANIINPPIANTDVTETMLNTPVTLATLSNDDAGVNGNPLNPASVTITDAPNHGTATVNTTTGEITYTPAAGFVGIDTLKYQVCSQASPVLCTEAYQIITVLPSGIANTTHAADDYNNTPFDTNVSGSVLTNDHDPEGNLLTVAPQTVTNSSGTLTLLSNGTYVFDPAPGFSGAVNYPYQICDNGVPQACDSATLYITVDPPVDSDPDINAGWVNTNITGNVSTNDDMPNGTTYGAPTAVAGNPNSTLPTINSDGTYTFNTTLPGVYQFLVPVCPPDGSACVNELLTITVEDANIINPPIANTDVTETMLNTPVTLATLSNDDAGVNGNPLNPASVTITDAPNHGSATVNTTTGEITYTPNTGFVGIDTLKYQVCSQASPVLCTEAYQIITVLPSGIANTTHAADDYNNTPYDTNVSGSVLTNDHDPEGNSVTVAPQTITNSTGTLTLLSNGTYVFDPAPGFSGAVNYPYQICDNGVPQACDSATLYITVDPPVDSDPDINAGWVNTNITGNVSTNDNMPNGTTYGTPTAVAGNPNSTLPTINSDGTYTFNTTLPGVYQFLVPVCPPDGSPCVNELLTITVQDGTIINPPIANTDITTTMVNTPVTLATLANDEPSANGKPLDPSTVTVIDQPNNGTVTVNPLTGEITYTPNTGFVGIDTLKYEVCAEPTATNVVLCATAYQIITILPSGIANSTTAADDYNSTPINTTTSGNVKTNDHDPELNGQSITPQTTTTAEGTLTLFADGTYTFVPATGYTGTVAYPYRVCDNGTPQACDSATLYINVYGATALPVSLKRFYGHIQNELTTLNWEVSNEDHFSHYELERSNDGHSFEKIASINAIGSSNYAYNDNVAGLTGKVFYRLKMVDINSEFGYSNVLNFNIGKLNIQHIAPNPASSYFDVTVSCDEAANATMILTDLTGRKILSREYALTTGTQKLHVDNLGTLSNGVYTMTLIYGNQRFIGKVLIK